MTADELKQKICDDYGLQSQQVVVHREVACWWVIFYRAVCKIKVLAITQYNNEEYSTIMTSTPYYLEDLDETIKLLQTAKQIIESGALDNAQSQ